MVDDPTENDEADYQASLEAARGSGWSWSDIWGHINGATAAAADAGYTQPEIDQHLGFVDPAGFEFRAKTSLAKSVGDETPPPVESDYAKALLAGEVKGPRDFAERYMVKAAEVSGGNMAAAAASAAGLVEGLPTREDLADASIALNPSDPAAARKRLMEHWAETGQQPVDAVVQAKHDPELAEKLAPTTWTPPTLAELSTPARDAIEKFYFVPGEELPDAKTVHEAIVDLGIDIATVAGLNLAGKYVVMPLLRAAGRKLAEIPEWLTKLAGETKTDMVDLTAPPGRATSEISVLDALTPPKPASIIEFPVSMEQRPLPEELRGFDPESTPAERMESLARVPEIEENPGGGFDIHTNGPAGVLYATTREEAEQLAAKNGLAGANDNSFVEAAKSLGVTDKPTLDLARGHDDTASVGAWFRDVFKGIMEDESGAGPGITPPADELEAGSRRARILGKNTADELIRRISTGLATQKTESVAQAAETFFKDLAPYMPRYKAELAKPYGGDFANTEIGQLLNAIEGKGTVAPDSPFAPYYRWRLEENTKIQAEYDAQVAKGNINELQWRENYIAHLYTPESIGLAGKGTGSGRQGSLGFTKQRTQLTYEDAIAEGLKPLHENPLVMDLVSLHTKRSALATVEMQGIAKEANWMRYYADPREAVRDGFRPLNGLNSEKIASTLETDAEGNVAGGRPAIQKLYAPQGFDTIWNNWVGWENLNRSKVGASIEDTMLRLKNGSTYMKLLLPGYHTISEYKDGMESGLGNVMLELANGLKNLSPGELARGVWDAALTPIKPFVHVYQAATKWRPMYRAMEADPALDAFVGAGGGFPALQKVYRATDAPTLWRSFSRGMLTQELVEDLTKAITFPKTRNEGGLGGVAADLGSLIGLPFREIARVSTSLVAPVWNQMIPLMKGGAAIERIATFIRQNPNAADETLRAFARQVVTNTEDRFGEYNNANLYWNPTLKRIANQIMLSTSWAYGTIHSVLTGLGWNPGRGLEWNPVATTNLAAQVGVIAMTNAGWTYLIDGKLPNNTLDYLVPFANARAMARILLPGQEKEYYDWQKIGMETFAAYSDKGVGAGFQQFGQSLFKYGEGKLAPAWQAISHFFTGEDAIGHKMAYTPSGMAGWLMNEFLPIFVNSWDKAKSIGLNAVENMLGIREAPKYLADAGAFFASQTKLHDRWTKEELQRAGREAIQLGQEPPEGYKAPGGSRGSNNIQRTHAQRVNDFLSATSAQQVQSLSPGRGSVSNVRDRGQQARQGSPAFERVWASSRLYGQDTTTLRGGYRGIPPETVVNGVSSRTAAAPRTTPSRGRGGRGRRR